MTGHLNWSRVLFVQFTSSLLDNLGTFSKCFQCKKLEAPRGEQLMADLPKERLMSGKPPFSYIGVDYFGHVLVRQGRSS